MTAMSRKQWLIVLGALIVAFYIAFGVIERSLPEGTPGVIQYEFVGSEDRAAEMLAEWGDAGQDDIRLSLWIDYGFMLVYGAFFTLAGLATRDFARERRKTGAGLGGPLGTLVRRRRGDLRRARERQPAAHPRRPRRLPLPSPGDRLRERQVPADRDRDRLCGVGVGGAVPGAARLIAVKPLSACAPLC